MRLLVDEDLASRELLARLEHVLPGLVTHAVPGTSDDRLRDLRFGDIATGVATIARDHPGGLHGLVLVVNDVARRESSA